MSHLEMLQHLAQEDPWQIAHRLWTCKECPKLAKCLKARQEKPDTTERCRWCIEEWLSEEIEPKKQNRTKEGETD